MTPLPPTFTEETKRFDAEFRKPLQAVLNKYFPKVHEEGEEKRLMKRGEALVLYGEAVTLGRKLYDLGRAETLKEVRELCAGLYQVTCGCTEDPSDEAPGYHTKNCDLRPYGFNAALDEITRRLTQ